MVKFIALSLLFVGVVSSSTLRVPTPADLQGFLRATPKFPVIARTIIPQLISNARVDYGVGLPGGRAKAKESCSENRTLALWDYGVIVSPQYPEDYPPSTVCEWKLEAPEGTKIDVTIFDIDIQPWFLNYFDALSISKDGAFYRVDNYAGDQNSKTPFTVVSNGTTLGIRFKTDALLNYRGFKLAYVVKPVDGSDYTSTDDGICGRTAIAQPATTTAAPEATTPVPTDATVVETPTNDTRIIGDTPVVPHSLPWMVAMLIDGKSFCGGSIIDQSHVLTAGHCTEGAEQITILIGANNLTASKDQEPFRQVVNVTKENIFTHPKYNGENVFNDISIIRLPENLTYSDDVRPVCLPTRKYLAETFDQMAVTVAGWGITKDAGKVSPVLQATNVTVLGNDKCRQVFRDILTGNNICVKTTPTNSPCRGDSGGPLMIKEAEGQGVSERYTQVGIVSFGTFTCQRGFPVSFTRLTAFLDYINTITGKSL